MSTYIISYDLAEGGDYGSLIAAIKAYKTWAHITNSTWAIVTENTTGEIRDNLAKYLVPGSRLMVVKSGSVGSWRNVICSNEWLKKNL